LKGNTPDSIILGIDPGSRFTGYGIIWEKASEHGCITHGRIRLTQKTLSERLYYIFGHLIVRAGSTEKRFSSLGSKIICINTDHGGCYTCHIGFVSRFCGEGPSPGLVGIPFQRQVGCKGEPIQQEFPEAN